VAHYWPEFAQNGKGAITVRQLLAHQAGLFALDVPITRELVTDLDRLAGVLARQTPAWPAGERQAYHGITLGLYQGELMRRIDPRHRTLGQFFHDHVATPLGLDTYIRLPHTVPDVQLATISRPGMMKMVTGFPLRFLVDVYKPHSNIRRALDGSQLPHDPFRVYARDLESPSGSGITTARGLARAYSAFASGGELGLAPHTLSLLAAPPVPSRHGFFDECMKGEARFSLGFMKPSHSIPFGSPSSFGSPGAGGAMGFADPASGIGYGYVTSQMGTSLTGDPRDLALREALYAALR
jgi:CubicO group peptidase (beta-lactamase class C family)